MKSLIKIFVNVKNTLLQSMVVNCLFSLNSTCLEKYDRVIIFYRQSIRC